MSSIQELHDLVNTNVTQQGGSDRITGVEVRQVQNATIDELATRGMINIEETYNFIQYTRSESGNILIPNNGIYIPLESNSAPDHINTFPSGEAGWLWVKAVGGSSNFANADLTLSGNRTHLLNGNTLELKNGTASYFKIDPGTQKIEIGNVNKLIIDDVSGTIKIKKPVPDDMDYMLLDLVNENYTIGRSEGYTRMVLHGINGMHISAYNPTTTTAVGISSINSDVIRPTMYMSMSVSAAATDARIAMFLNVASVQSHLTVRNKILSFHTHDPADVNYFLIDATPGLNRFQLGDTTENNSGMLMDFNEATYRMDWRMWGSRVLGYDDMESILYLGDADDAMSRILLTVDQNSRGVKIFDNGVKRVSYEGGANSFDIATNYFTMKNAGEDYVSFNTVSQAYRIGKADRSRIEMRDDIPYIQIITVPAAGGYGAGVEFSDTQMDITYGGGKRLVYGNTIINKLWFGDHNVPGTGAYLAIGLDQATKDIIFYTSSATLLKTDSALSNNAGALAGTLNNAPAAGDPTKWISINDAGTIRRIPTW